MKRNRKFLIGLSLFALTIILLIAFLFSGRKDETKEAIEEVDYTYNILKNSDFEEGNFNYWKKNFLDQNENFSLIDDIVKFEGDYSLNLTSELDTNYLTVYQTLSYFPKDKKLILNAKVRIEGVSAAFLSIKLFSGKDSLLAVAATDTLKGTSDWTHLTTWVRTINPELSYIKVECNLKGKGRVWFDKIELYPVEIPSGSILPITR